MACVRMAWLICAKNNVELQVKHVRGSANVYADILSRWEYYQNFQSKFNILNPASGKFLICSTCFPIFTFNVHYNPPFLGGMYPLACASVLPRFLLILGSKTLQWLAGKVSQHVASGLLPCTSATYTRGFHLFLAVTIYMSFQCPWEEIAVLSFL